MSDTKRLFKGCPLCDQASQVFAEQSPIHELLHTEVKADGETIVFAHSDVFLLFNQDRLERTLGVDTLRSWLNDVRPNNSPNLSAQFSDEQLASFIKSKYVQSLSEVSDWYNYLRQNTANVRSSLERYIAQSKSKEEPKIKDKDEPKTKE